MTERAKFFRLRDPRTLEYGANEQSLERPVALLVGDRVGHSRTGQLAALAAANLVARVHRKVFIQAPSADLVARAPFSSAQHLSDAMAQTALAVCPYAEIVVGPIPPDVPSLAFGAATGTAPIHVGVQGCTAGLSREPIGFCDSSASALGAALAACLGSAALFRIVHDLSPAFGFVSAWDLTESAAATGPEHIGPLDVGEVALVGAGAVGQAVAYWLAELGHVGRWHVIDGDGAELHNTNRSLGITPADAGWPAGPARAKAHIAAKLLGGEACAQWYHQWIDANPHTRPDLVIPVANGPGVRAAINGRGEALLIHATTSRAWQAQLHRHIAVRDGCIMCRIEDTATAPPLGCSTAPVTTAGGHQTDAALPFLSAAAGLLVVAALYRLQLGELAAGEPNFWGLDFTGPQITVRRHTFPCLAGCASVLPAAVRERLNARTRWRNVR